MSTDTLQSKKGTAKGAVARKRVWSDYNVDGAFDDIAGARRNQRRRPQPENTPTPSSALESCSDPSSNFVRTVKRIHSATGALGALLSRPPKGTALATTASGTPGAPQLASGVSGSLSRAASSPLRKQSPPNKLTNASKSFSEINSVPAQVGRPSAITNVPETVLPSLRNGIQPSDPSDGALDDKALREAREASQVTLPKDQDDVEYGWFPSPSRSASHNRGGTEHVDSHITLTRGDDSSVSSESEESCDSSEIDSDADDVEPLHNSPQTSRTQIPLEWKSSTDSDSTDVDTTGALLRIRGRQGKLRDSLPRQSDPAAQLEFQEITKTPSGKPYHMFNDNAGSLKEMKGMWFPDNYHLQNMAAFPGYHFICPVRDCRTLFKAILSLANHFRAAHPHCHFIDNLDEEGTLTVHKRMQSGRSMVVMQAQLTDGAPALKAPSLPNSLKRSRSVAAELANSDGDDAFNPSDINRLETRALPNRYESDKTLTTEFNASRSANPKAVQSIEETSPESFAVEAAEIESETWGYIEPFVSTRWLSCFQSERDRLAFLQAISLQRRNDMDKAWLEGTRRSHQKAFKALLSIVLHVVGVKTSCSNCERRSNERRRNCVGLPPEAKDMRELRDVIGSKCVNCFFFPASKFCVVATIEPSSDEASISDQESPMPDSTQLQQHPHGGTKGYPGSQAATELSSTALAGPIPNSLVPVPAMPPQPQKSQAQVPETGSPSGIEGQLVRRSGRRFGRAPDNFNDSRTRSEVTTSEDSSSGAATVVASSSESSAPPASSAFIGKAFKFFGEITELSAHEQNVVYEKVAMMLDIARGGPTKVGTIASGTGQGDVPHRPQAQAVDEWEIAPGHLTYGSEHIAFSTAFLRRETVNLRSAYPVSSKERVLNKHIAALNHLKIERKVDWDCELIVMGGLVRVKMGELDKSVEAGGLFRVKHDCMVINALQEQSRIHVRWKMADE